MATEAAPVTPLGSIHSSTVAKPPVLVDAARPGWRAPLAPAAIVANDLTDAGNPLRSMAFWLALCLIFIKFGMVQEIQTQLMGFNGKILYLFGIPAICGLFLTGGFQRALSVRTGIYWAAYGVWFVIGTPFSTWRGGSVPALLDFIRTDWIMVFIVGGLVTTWDECKKVGAAIGLAGILNVISGRIFAGQMSDRYALAFGTVSNPNDYAAHLILVLPFVLYLAMSKRALLLRAAAMFAVCVGVYYALKTASRGAEVALAADALLFFVAGNMKRRVSVLLLAPIAAVSLVLILPDNVLYRLRSLSSSESGADAEALESSEARYYVLRKSIQYAFEFPVFGLGMAQFSVYEGGHSQVIGTHGYWHDSHNSFTQAASEGGLPAGLLLLAGYVSSFLIFRGINKRARARSDCVDIELLSFYAMVAVSGFVVAITLLNFAYFFYGPALGGFAVAMKRACDVEMAKRAAALGLGAAAAPIPNGFMRAQPQS